MWKHAFCFEKGHVNTEAPALRGRQEARARSVAMKTSRLAPDFLFTKGHWTCSLGLFKKGRPLTSAHKKIIEPSFFPSGIRQYWRRLATSQCCFEKTLPFRKYDGMYAEGTASYSHTQEGGWSRDSDRGDLGVLMHRGSRVSRGVFFICWLMNSGWYEPERRSKTLCTDELYIEAQTFLLPCFVLFCFFWRERLFRCWRQLQLCSNLLGVLGFL